MDREDKEILTKNGWEVECESPFEIRHEDGSFATQQAAWIVLQDLRGEESIGHCNHCLTTIWGFQSHFRDEDGKMYHDTCKIAKRAIKAEEELERLKNAHSD